MIHWREFSVPASTSVLEALSVIDRAALQFALVVENDTLVGLATDGDVRRALMHGVPTTAPIRLAMNQKPVVGLGSETPQDWRRKLREHRIKYLPIVDAAGRLLRVVNELTCAHRRDNWAVVMAGGLGTRLRPITEQVPKPMLEIGGTPILETILRSLIGAGVGRVFLAVNYRAEMIEEYFGDGSRWDVQIEYLRESRRMGTAGALGLLPQQPQAPLLVMNGDIITGLNFSDFLDGHGRTGALATVCVREYSTQIPFGVVETEGDELRAITEKPVMRHLASAGIYAISAAALAHVPQDSDVFDMPMLLQRLMERRQRVCVYRIDDYWIDIGQMNDLERARKDFGKSTHD